MHPAFRDGAALRSAEQPAISRPNDRPRTLHGRVYQRSWLFLRSARLPLLEPEEGRDGPDRPLSIAAAMSGSVTNDRLESEVRADGRRRGRSRYQSRLLLVPPDRRRRVGLTGSTVAPRRAGIGCERRSGRPRGVSKVANLSSPTPVTTALTPGDDILSASTLRDGMIGSRLPVKTESAGTYGRRNDRCRVCSHRPPTQDRGLTCSGRLRPQR